VFLEPPVEFGGLIGRDGQLGPTLHIVEASPGPSPARHARERVSISPPRCRAMPSSCHSECVPASREVSLTGLTFGLTRGFSRGAHDHRHAVGCKRRLAGRQMYMGVPACHS
jgi:hypothetical protein